MHARALAVNGLTGAPVTVTAGLMSLVVDRFDWAVVDFDELPPAAGRLVDVRILTVNENKITKNKFGSNRWMEDE